MKVKAHQRYRSKTQKLKNGKGKIFPGVTTIIDGQLGWNKRILMAWSRREALAGHDPDLVKQEAADIGTLTHYLIECHIKDKEANTSDYSANQIEQAENGYLAYLEWEEKNNLDYIGAEVEVVSEEYEYGGMLDILAKTNGQVWQIDLKTSKDIYPEMKLQQAAYKHAYEEQSGNVIDQCHIVQLSKKNGSFHHYKLNHKVLTDSWLAFTYLRRLYNLQRRIK